MDEYLGNDDEDFDDWFGSTETHISKNRWEEAQRDFTAFIQELEKHFAMEEKILFPEFEKATGSNQGPTSVMRMEHQQMRAMLPQLQDSLSQHDADNFFGYSDTFNTMIQQHNMKEETILYVMTDRVLAGRQDEVIGAMNSVAAAA